MRGEARDKSGFRARLAASALVCAGLAALAATPTSAGAATYAPPKGYAYTAFLDTKDTDINDYANLSAATGKHAPVIHTWNEWGNGLWAAVNRWASARARPMVTISTLDGDTGSEIITPLGIAIGAGDDHLLNLNEMFGQRGIIAYIRPLAEPNRWGNPYSAYNGNGRPRDAAHSKYWYIKAFRRIVIILRGGSLGTVNSLLAAEGLPPVTGANRPVPASLPTPPLAFLWTPLVYGSPRIKGNAPGKYYPGSTYVDWVGTDFYSNYPAWKWLNRLYRKFRGKPFAFGEWGVTGADNPKFVKRFFRWQRRHRRVRLMAYYQGFGSPTNAYHLNRYPRSRAMYARQVRGSRYPPFAPSPPTLRDGPGGATIP